MNIDRKCLSRDFLLSIRDSVIQTQYFNAGVLTQCDLILPPRCIRPINYSALTPTNRKLFEALPISSCRMRWFFALRENCHLPVASRLTLAAGTCNLDRRPQWGDKCTTLAPSQPLRISAPAVVPASVIGVVRNNVRSTFALPVSDSHGTANDDSAANNNCMPSPYRDVRQGPLRTTKSDASAPINTASAASIVSMPSISLGSQPSANPWPRSQPAILALPPNSDLSELRCKLLNIRSLKSKSLLIRDDLLRHDIDVFLLTETWLTSCSGSTISECTPDEYTPLRRDRGTKQGWYSCNYPRLPWLY